MKYISRITIDKAIASRRGLHGLYNWHKEAWSLFPDRPKDKRNINFHFLTRLESDEQEFRLTILSDIEPQKPDWCFDGSFLVKEIPATFFTQKKYLFQVLANPTKTLSNRDPKGNKKKHGSHYAITKPDEIREWFLRKAEQSGFRTLDVPQLDIGKPIFYKLHKKEHEGTIIGVEFKGGLEVIKKENFLKVVREGIGRARGFGFGMLVLKPMA